RTHQASLGAEVKDQHRVAGAERGGERAQAEVGQPVLGRVLDGGGEQPLPGVAARTWHAVTVPCGTVSRATRGGLAMGHKEIDVRQVIPAPPAAVFATLLDRSEWPAWSGHTKFEVVRPAAARGVMREEIVEVVGDRRIGYTLLAGLPLRDYRAGFELAPVQKGTAVS